MRGLIVLSVLAACSAGNAVRPLCYRPSLLVPHAGVECWRAVRLKNGWVVLTSRPNPMAVRGIPTED